MQPKAAKKIGGMTPKKMTGGEDTKEFDFDGTKYSIKKTQKDDTLEICVSAAMPGAAANPPTNQDEGADGEEGADGAAVPPQGAAVPPQGGPEVGGKKKRKSSKKRKSMKKKGGMRKSMKVKA